MVTRTTSCRRLGRACPQVCDDAEQGPYVGDLAIVTPDRFLLLSLLVLAVGWGVWRLRLRRRRGPAEASASARTGALVPLDPAADDAVLEVAARMILEAFPANSSPSSPTFGWTTPST